MCKMKGVLLILLLATMTIQGLKYTETRTSIDPSNDEIVEAGDFVLRELRKLSDSGIYETLKLKTIVSAETMAGACDERHLCRCSSRVHIWRDETQR